jgi:YD repeat-containing protein
MLSLRLSLGFFGLVALGVACGDPPEDTPPPSPPRFDARPGPTIEIDGSYPDEPPYVFVSLQVWDDEQTPTTLSVDRVELFEAGSVEPVATLHGRLEPPSFDFADGPQDSTYFLDPVELNAELAAACDATSLKVHLRGSACECSIVVESSVNLKCVPDVRAGELLAEEGEPAPTNKPCAMQRFSDDSGEEQLDEEHRYGYDGDGRLRMIDVTDAAGSFVRREVFTYESNGYLKEEAKIDAQTGLIAERTTFTYDDDGLLATQQYDGELDRVDGVIDWTAAYSFAGSVWTETFTFTDPNQGDRGFDYTYDESELTVTTEDGNVITLAQALESPNQIFAMPEEVDTPKILSSAGISWEYADDGRLLRVTYPSFFDTTREEYLYSCD